MKIATIIARVLLGFVFVGSGIAFFLVKPPELQDPMLTFFKGMAITGYFFYLLKFTEIVCGLMLMAGRFVPLALVVLAPIIINIFFVHLFLDRQGLPIAIILGVLESYLAFFSREYSPTIKMLFRAKP